MDWSQAFMIAGSTIGVCYWMHKENKELSKEFQRESKNFHASMKEFHGRLCTLKERYLQILQKQNEK